MKRIIFSGLFIVCVGCNNESKTVADATTDSSGSDSISTDTSQPSPPPPVDIEKWRIHNDTANKMIRYVGGCSRNCKNQKRIVDSNLTVRRAIEAEYRPPATITPMEARYKDKWEADNYCIVRGFSTSPNGRCGVKKFKTIIYKVVIPNPQSSAQPAFTERFYDIVTICPPPEGGTPADCGFPFVPDSTKKKK